HQRQKLLQNLRVWVCSGEQFPSDLLDKFFDYFPSNHLICNFYGSTEVMGDVTYEVFDSLDEVKRKVIEAKVPIGMFILSNDCIVLGISRQDVFKETRYFALSP